MLEEKDQENNTVEDNPQVDSPETEEKTAVATAEEVVEAATEATEEIVEEATEAVAETTEEVAEEATEAVAETTKEVVEEATEAVAETTEEVAEEATEAVAETTKEVVEEATEAVAETTEEVAEEATEAVAEATTESSDEETEEEEEEVIIDETPVLHDDFDWALSNKYGIAYSDEEKEKLLKQYDATLSSILENQIVKGTVTAINSGDVVLDINYKSDGLVSLSEFRDMPELTIGDAVDVYVEQQEDARGQLILSRRKAKLLRAWESIRDSYENGTVITGTIISKTKGGLIVDCSGLETFLPGSQIDIKPIIDYDAYVGKTMEFKVVKINEAIKNAVVSHKALIESDLAEQREAIIASLEKGQVLEGLVKNITDFGAFLDLGGVDGLLYITDISWGRDQSPKRSIAAQSEDQCSGT